jgi:hypothetical protein
MAPKRLKRNFGKLKSLAKADEKSMQHMLKDRDLMCCVCDCACNFLKGNVPLTVSQIDVTRPYKNSIRKLADSSVPRKDKKHEIEQKGGAFLPLLLAPILSAVGGLIADTISGSKV